MKYIDVSQRAKSQRAAAESLNSLVSKRDFSHIADNGFDYLRLKNYICLPAPKIGLKRFALVAYKFAPQLPACSCC